MQQEGVEVMDSAIEWQVPCRNLAGRRRAMHVLAETGTGSVIVMQATGEAAVFTPLEVGRFRGVLRQSIAALGWPVDPDRPLS